jgi:exonuclease SbcC
VRPLKLRLGGFTCFREAAEVSFEELGLFAISGPTGSGKSTLLDAITYALYGETARLGSRVGASLISPGVERLSVTLEFSTGGDAIHRVTRVSERKSGSPKNETRLERLDGGAKWRQLPESEKLREADQKLSEIVGLDYPSFTRAVLLPQGAFDKFLCGNAAERNRLLVKLLGLEGIRAMQQAAGERATRARLQAEGIRERLEQEYGDARPERKRELTDELATLKTRREELETHREAASKELAGLGEVKRLLDEQTKVHKELGTLQSQAGEIAQARASASRARDAALIAPQLTALEERQAKLQALEERRAKAQKELAEALAACEKDKAALDKAEKDAERLPELGERLEILAGLRPLLRQLEDKGGNLALAKQAGGSEYSDTLWEEWQKRKGRLGDLEQARVEVNRAEKALASAKTAAEEAKRAVAGLEAELEALLEPGRSAKARAEQARAACEEAEVADRAAALRPHLHVGEPCPVCAQTVRTLPPPLESRVEALRKARDEAESAHKELQERYREAQADLKAKRERLTHRETEVERVTAELERYRARLRQEAEPFADLGNSPKEIEAALEAQRKALLAGLALSIVEKSGGLDPSEVHARLNEERKRLEQALKKAQTCHQDSEHRRDRLHDQHESLGEQLSELTDEVARARQGLEAALQRADFADAAALRGATLTAARLEALEAKIRNHENQRELAERRDVELSARLAGRTLDEEAYAALKVQEDEAERGLEQVQQRVGAVKHEFDELEERLVRAERLKAQGKTLEAVQATYSILHRDLQSNRFPDFIMARVQRELAQRASAIIREITDGRYDLTFAGGEYSVLDAWGTGELRSARTLSGGESFIASLALALALSDTLAGNRSLGALFLDEGFGTLDAETLDAVTAVLESLSESGRMVGVITHVGALTERLPARLLVSKGPDGSRLAWDG